MNTQRHRELTPGRSRPGLLLIIEPLEERRAPAAFVVTSDMDPTEAGKVTLRDAINMSNATPGANTITFDIGGGGSEAVINLASPLPGLTVPVTILGGTQTNTTYTTPGVVLNGSAAGIGDGFDVLAGNSTIEGFIIENFSGHGVMLSTVGNDEVINDCIGTNAAHDGAAPNTLDGVLVNNIAHNAIQSCIISGNIKNGIELTGASASNNLIGTGPTANATVGTASGYGNYIGVDYDASGAIANNLDGILIHGGANKTTITGNVISANLMNGVEINGSGSTLNVLTSNVIGATGDGTAALGNSLDGILISNAPNNTIGGTGASDGNLISGNLHNGINITGGSTTNTMVLGNMIGTDITGDNAIANQMDGILINGSPGNFIGTATAGASNQISGNTMNGIHISGAASIGNSIVYNNIGTNGDGTDFVSNIGDGVLIDTGATGNLIGGTTKGYPNVISGNGLSGVEINGQNTSGNTIQNNLIGTTADGLDSLGNLADGVTIDNAPSNTIGGTTQPLGNVISGNGINGIDITGANAMLNMVFGNKIGTDINGANPVDNINDGILIEQGANNNTIGTSGTADAINVISGNDQNGIEINGMGASGNTVQNCYIGTDVMGLTAIENGNDGVLIMGAAGNFIGGTNEQTGHLVQGNLISGNVSDGVEINGGGASGNHIRGNFIGTAYLSLSALPNGDQGVDIQGAPGNIIGSATGESSDYRNVISGNGDNGVLIDGSASAGTALGGNYIGTDINGTIAVGNTNDGVLISDAPGTVIANINTSVNAIISGNGANGVEISGSDATGTKILTIQIGTDNNGNAALGNTDDGVLIDGASDVTIRTCLLSGNGANGVHIMDGASAVTLDGCQIGVQLSNPAALPNTNDGVLIDTGSNGNFVGTGSSPNIISGNGVNGIEITGAGTTNNLVQGDWIGVNPGPVVIPNVNDGVLIGGGATGNFIGTGATHNIISGNTVNGVEISDTGTNGNFVQGNYIGTDSTGMMAFPNGQHGVMIDNDAANNTIGGAASGPGAGIGNVISGNAVNGIDIEGLLTTGNMIQGNIIGANAAGTGALPNAHDGVFIGNDAFGNFIGLAGLGTHNIISGNGANGVEINGLLTSLNVVQNNAIGLDTNGNALPNVNDGVLVTNGANNNDIGGIGATLNNIISGNTGNGVEINGAGTIFNTVQNNFIGLDGGATGKVPNGRDGVLVTNGATNNFIGVLGGGNLIGGNTMNGVELNGAATTGNSLSSNHIGTNAADAAGLGNTLDGVLVNAATTNMIGTAVAGEDNVISGNGMNGVHLINNANGNLIQNNFIGSNSAGTMALPNTGSGVFVAGSNNNTIGGPLVPQDNLIDFNGKDGVTIASGTGNRIQQNSIFSNGRLGIDLDNNGIVNPNVPGGPHAGANDDQNYPVIQSAAFLGPLGTNVSFTLNSTPNTRFVVEIFGSPVGNAAGFGEGKTFLLAVPVVTDRTGDVSMTVTVPNAPAGTVLAATATDVQTNPGDTSEFSADKTVPDTYPPTVDNVTFVYTKNKVTGVDIAFNEQLTASTVNTNNFELFSAGAHNTFSTLIALSHTNPIQYNAANDTVILTTLKPLPASQFIKVFVNGTTNPVTDLAGTALDGEFSTTLPSGNGTPGGDFDALVAYGTHFAYTDSHSNAVTLTLSHGGTMELIRSVNGEGRYLELANVIASKTILSGTVKKGTAGTGVTTLEGITGLDGATDKLPPTEFTVANPNLAPFLALATSEQDLLAPWSEADAV